MRLGLMLVTDDAEGVVLPMHTSRRPTAATNLFTVKDLAEASGLPQPVIAQLVPRTDTAAGILYTAAQRQYAVDIGHELRSRRT